MKNMKKTIVIMLSLIMLLSIATMNGPSAFAAGEVNKEAEARYEEGMALVRENQREAAFAPFMSAAEAGYPPAMGELAWMYLTGDGVAPDIMEAFKWAEKGAELNDAECLNLYSAILGMDGVSYDEDKALKMLFEGLKKKDNDQDVKASINMGLDNIAYNALHPADGSEPDEQAVRDLISRMEKAGAPTAKYFQGELYYSGYWVEPDVGKAIELYENAAELGHGHAASDLGFIYAYGYSGKQDFDEALKWFEKSVDNGGSTSPIRTLAVSFLNGEDNLPKDPIMGLKWMEKAAELGNEGAMYDCGLLLMDDNYGIPADLKKAAKWMEKAAENGVQDAMTQIAGMYFRGEGVEENEDTAAKWYIEASKSAAEDDLAFIAKMINYCAIGHAYEDGGHYDPKEAVRLLEIAADLGSKEAMENLGKAYALGLLGIEVNESVSNEWFQKAGNGKGILQAEGWAG